MAQLAVRRTAQENTTTSSAVQSGDPNELPCAAKYSATKGGITLQYGSKTEPLFHTSVAERT